MAKSKVKKSNTHRGFFSCFGGRGGGTRTVNIYDRESLRDRYHKFKDWTMSDETLIQLAKRFQTYSVQDEMTKPMFKQMMGVIGETYFAIRMFEIIDEDSSGTINLGEYLDFNDIMMHGDEDEKKQQNFKFMDIKGQGEITLDGFEEFIFNILDMYHQTLSAKVETERDNIKKKFYDISGGKEKLTYKEYCKALDKNPKLFEWLERPKEMVNDIINEKMYQKETVNKLLHMVGDFISTTKMKLRGVRGSSGLNKSSLEEASQISFSKTRVGNKGSSPFGDNNPFMMTKRKTTKLKDSYEDPEDYDESAMEEGVPVKENLDFFKGLNDYYSPFHHLVCSQVNRKKRQKRPSGK